MFTYNPVLTLYCVCAQHRRLDAVYYYLRSLFAKTPVQSAHDSLVGLFEESSRKVSVHTTLYTNWSSSDHACLQCILCVCVYVFMACIFLPLRKTHIVNMQHIDRRHCIYMSVFVLNVCVCVCVCVCVQALKVEEEREKEREKREREALRRKRRTEKREKMRKKGGGGGRDRYEIVFLSGHKEVWVVPGSEEWHTLRRGRGGGGGGGGGGADERKGAENETKGEGLSDDAYCEPEEEVTR